MLMRALPPRHAMVRCATCRDAAASLLFRHTPQLRHVAVYYVTYAAFAADKDTPDAATPQLLPPRALPRRAQCGV